MAKKDYLIGIYGTAYIEVFHRPVTGALRYCEQAGGFNIVDFRMSHLPELEKTTTPPWSGKVDGVITAFGLLPGVTAKQSADWCLSGGAPVVSVAADWFDPRIPTVYVDRPSLAKLATEHLLECECKSYLYWGYINSAGSKARAAAFREELTKSGKKLSVVETDYVYVGSYDDKRRLEQETKVAEFLQTLPKPIGLWALNDNFARAACLICEQLKLQVPEQVKILGVDDFALARMHHPTISSIRTPGEEIGYQAMRELHKLIERKRGVRETVLVKATELAIRESTVKDQTMAGDLETVMEYIERHACQGVTVEQILSIVGGSQRSLSDRFREHFGRSITEEIQRVRLERAKNLLTQTKLSMTRIASMIGYAETAAFSKFFRKAMGVSPREYRDQAKK